MYGKNYNKNYYNKGNKYYNQKKSKKNIHISKFLSLILRHKAKDFGLDIDSAGFIKLDDIINLPRSKKLNINLSLIQEIVSNDEKGRFELINRPPYYIRAVQGHSIKEVSNEDTMYKLNKNNIFDFPTVVHGTQENAWKLIEKSGLNKMNRNAIHFSIGYNDENHVKSGMRLNCEIFIEINPQMAFFNGYEFFLSQNKVSCQYEIFIKYKFLENKNIFEIIIEDNKSIFKSNEPNEIVEYLITKELMKERIITLVNENEEEKYIKFIKDGIENGKIIYPSLFVDYLIDNNNDEYKSEYLKKVEINWNEFYEKKEYEKEEDKKEDNKDNWKMDEKEDD